MSIQIILSSVTYNGLIKKKKKEKKLAFNKVDSLHLP